MLLLFIYNSFTKIFCICYFSYLVFDYSHFHNDIVLSDLMLALNILQSTEIIIYFFLIQQQQIFQDLVFPSSANFEKLIMRLNHKEKSKINRIDSAAAIYLSFLSDYYQSLYPLSTFYSSYLILIHNFQHQQYASIITLIPFAGSIFNLL